MKNPLLSLLLLITFLTCPLFADNGDALESLTFGLRYWYPEWELEGYSDFDTLKWGTDYGMIGPSAAMVINDKWAISASFYLGSFEKKFDTVVYQNRYTEATWTSDRTDFDLALVYVLNKYVNFFAGLKYLTYDQTIKGSWFNTGSWQIKYDIGSYGPGLGASLNIPLGTQTALFASLSYSYLFGNFDLSVPSGSLNKGSVIYPILGMETGARYALDSLPFVFMLSWRYQKSTINIDWDTDWPDYWDQLDEKFYGIILFAGYRFDLY